MKKLLKEKYTLKMTAGQILLEILLGTIFWSIIFYICVSNKGISDSIVLIFNSVTSGKISALNLTIIFIPIIIILLVMGKTEKIVIYANKK